MLAQLSRQRRALQQLGPLAVAGCAALQQSGSLQQSRGMSMRIFEIFSKAKREERRKKLREEMERGYFDDFRDFRDKKGKMFMASDRLIPASQARPFPGIEALRPDGSPATFPPQQPEEEAEGGGRQAGGGTLLCVAFRAGAQDMLEAWGVPFSEHFKGRPGLSICELSLVESVVMRAWPFKQAILRGGSQGQDKYRLPVSYLFHFGGTEPLREALFMTNRLTGYVYLVDPQGRVRWRGSGSPDQTELTQLLCCTEALLKQQGATSSGGSRGGALAAGSSSSGGGDGSSGAAAAEQ